MARAGRLARRPRSPAAPHWPAWPRPAPADTDGDGMPAAWERALGLNPHDPSDRNGDRDGDGYTNLEEYLNGLRPAP